MYSGHRAHSERDLTARLESLEMTFDFYARGRSSKISLGCRSCGGGHLGEQTVVDFRVSCHCGFVGGGSAHGV